jgi:hypothetical protein
MKMKNITKWLLIPAACGFLSLASAQASTIDLTGMSYTTDSPYLVGTVIPQAKQSPGQVDRDRDMVNTLLAGPNNVACNQCQWTTGTGTHNDPFILWSHTNLTGPAATSVGAVALDQAHIAPLISGGFVYLNLANYGTFHYMVVAYDGSQSGVAVFDISSFTTADTLKVWAKAAPAGNTGDLTGNTTNYGITSITFLNPTGGGSVPDGGATVMLLGAGLGALGMARRYFKK